MRKKIIIMTIISIILTAIIYFYTRSDELTLVAIGDSLSLGMTPYNIEGYSFNDYLREDLKSNHKLKKYIYEFASSNKTVKELIYEIKDNKSIVINNKQIDIQQVINEADILTVAIGLDEIQSKKLTTSNKKEFTRDVEELFSILKMLNQNKTIIIGIYDPNINNALTISKINALIRDCALKNNFIFIDISDIGLNLSYYLDPKSYYLNYLGHKEIYTKIKKVL